jgi:hypothetical protein
MRARATASREAAIRLIRLQRPGGARHRVRDIRHQGAAAHRPARHPARPGGQASILDRPEAQAIRSERDPRRLLRRFARDYAAMSERVPPVSEVLRTAKAVEPQMAAVRKEMEACRLEYMRTIVGWLADLATLRVPVSAELGAVTREGSWSYSNGPLAD